MRERKKIMESMRERKKERKKTRNKKKGRAGEQEKSLNSIKEKKFPIFLNLFSFPYME